MAYSKHNFQVGQIFTAAQANSIDRGILDNEEKIGQMEAMFVGKLNKNQGAQNAGNVLIVESNGEISATAKMPEVDATLSTAGAAADAKQAGDKLSTIRQDMGNKYELGTQNKTSLVAAITEVATAVYSIDLEVTEPEDGYVVVKFK